MANPAPANFDREAKRRTTLALWFWLGPTAVMVALGVGYALGTHASELRTRLALGVLLLLAAASCTAAGLALQRRTRERRGHAYDFLCHGGSALALYCLSVIASFGLVVALLVGCG